MGAVKPGKKRQLQLEARVALRHYDAKGLAQALVQGALLRGSCLGELEKRAANSNALFWFARRALPKAYNYQLPKAGGWREARGWADFYSDVADDARRERNQFGTPRCSRMSEQRRLRLLMIAKALRLAVNALESPRRRPRTRARSLTDLDIRRVAYCRLCHRSAYSIKKSFEPYYCEKHTPKTAAWRQANKWKVEWRKEMESMKREFYGDGVEFGILKSMEDGYFSTDFSSWLKKYFPLLGAKFADIGALALVQRLDNVRLFKPARLVRANLHRQLANGSCPKKLIYFLINVESWERVALRSNKIKLIHLIYA